MNPPREVLFSVLIPTYERLGMLPGLLEAWAAVEWPAGGFELILADDGSSVSPREIVNPFFERLPMRFLQLPHEGLSSARQSLLESARGDFVLITDDDCRPDAQILRAYERALDQYPGCACGGAVKNLLPGDIFAEATHTITTFVTRAWNAGPQGACFFTGSNLLFPGQALRGIGGFDRGWKCRTGEDRELCRRWMEAGHRMVFVPDALMGHAHGLDLRAFIHQHFHYGQGRWWTEQRRKIREKGPPGWSPPGFYFGLMLAAWRTFPPAKALRVFLLICLAQVATAAGNLQAGWQYRA